LQQSDVGGASTDGGEDVVADTLALTLLKLAALRFDFYSGMVLLLSVIVLSCNVLSCIFSAPDELCAQLTRDLFAIAKFLFCCTLVKHVAFSVQQSECGSKLGLKAGWVIYPISFLSFLLLASPTIIRGHEGERER